MAPRDFTITVRVDHYKGDKDETAKEIVRMAAKHLLTQMMLLQDRRAPQVAVESSDMFESSKEVMLADDMPEDKAEGEASETTGALTQNAQRARVGGYTVSDRGAGEWKFNDPDGKWSDLTFTTEGYAWEGAYADSLSKAG